MNPFLTAQGRWVLLSGVVFLLIGVLLSNPLILLLGQIHIVLLMSGVMLLVPGALALDRRMVKVASFDDLQDVKPRPGLGKVVGESSYLNLSVQNQAGVALHNLRARPFAGPGLKTSEFRSPTVLPGRREVTTRVEVVGERTGRWALHGFDVSISDPLGLVDTRDYLPSLHTFEVYPPAGPVRRRHRLSRHAPPSLEVTGAQVVSHVGTGSDLRELREYQPGDPLRDIAWKTSLRAQKLVSRDYEREVTTSTYILLDISSSMRGGHWSGQKLEFAIRRVVEMADVIIRRRDRVGLATFDEKMYGHIGLGQSQPHMRRILHHLVGLNAVVDPDMTELDDVDVDRLAADYLLVQERLDFRKGQVESDSGVNRKLLHRWLHTVEEQTATLQSPVLTDGVVQRSPSALRQFLQLRGVDVPFRVEARLGMKERGLVQTMEKVLAQLHSPARIVVVTDLCGILNPEVLVRSLRQFAIHKHNVEFEVLFTPAFYPTFEESSPESIIRELFTSAEADERVKVAHRLRQVGAKVNFVRPSLASNLRERESMSTLLKDSEEVM